MSEINLTINDQKVTMPEGASVLQACEELGIKIPTLCSHKALPAYGACRLCLVEIEDHGRTRIQASCVYPVRDGLVVHTDTERVHKDRKMMAELLLARSPNSEKVREIAAEIGVSETRFPKKDEDCILCGLCTRVCEHLMKSGVIAFTGRGYRKAVTPAYDPNSSICMTCGACQFICPTNAIKNLDKVSARKPRPITWEYNAGLVPRPSIYIPFQQAIPKVPVVDRSVCMHILKGPEVDACKACQSACPAGAIDFTQADKVINLDVGAVILAPGYCLYDPSSKLNLGYALYPNVVTSLEFERIQSASGPFEGRIQRPSDGTVPKKLAFIQCVGSRDEEHDYCSSVCCMYATKEAIITKEHDPDIECTIFFMDLRAFGKGFDAYYERALELGVRYIRCRPQDVEEIRETGELTIRYEAEDGKQESEKFDMVVLSVGIQPPVGAGSLAEIVGIERDVHGFAKTETFTPVQTTKDGVYVCGPFSEPKDIPETVMEASAAAANAMALLAEARGTEITEREYPPEMDVSGQEPRIGVFICHCGKNIAGVVDVKSVAQKAQSLPNVVHAEDNLYTCSSDTQERMQEMIKEHNLNRVVVASCTPRTHEPLFQNTIRGAGLNPYLFEMANIRDQCSWVHTHEPEKATDKSNDLVRMAVAKARMLNPLQKGVKKVNNAVLVIGGGPAGMTAASNLADQGFTVHLVEKDSELGGNLRKLKFLRTGEDPAEKLGELVSHVNSNEKINVFTNATVKSVEGSVGSFLTTVQVDGREVEIGHGAVVVAVGAQVSRPAEYLYGENENVITQLELEEKLAAGESPGKRVVMIQCVGSRDENHPYCSRVCCTQALKNALLIKRKFPKTDVIIIYRDIRTYGLRENIYTRAREAGVKFVRYEIDGKPVVSAAEKGLSVEVDDLVLKLRWKIDADTVVLAPAVIPVEDVEELAQVWKVPLNADNFFLEAHMKLRPMDFAVDGVYLCGMAHSPKSVDESISQAFGASARAATLLSKDELELEASISEIIDANCDGCGYCIEPCPYQALTLLEYIKEDQIKKTVENNSALCKGCGVCMATCPKLGIYVKHFKLEQLGAMVEAALEVS